MTEAPAVPSAAAAIAQTAPAPQPETPPKSRVSAEIRQAALCGWLLAGLSEEEVVERAQAAWPVRAGRIRRDLEAIRAAWDAEDEGEELIDHLRFAKRQRERLLSLTMRRLEGADAQDAVRLLMLSHKLMRERDQLAERIFELRERERAQLEPKEEAAQVAAPTLPTHAALPPSLARNKASAFPSAADLAALAGVPEDWLNAELNRQGGLASLSASLKPREGSGNGPKTTWPTENGAPKSAQAPRKSAGSAPGAGGLDTRLEAELLAGLKDTGFCPAAVAGGAERRK